MANTENESDQSVRSVIYRDMTPELAEELLEKSEVLETEESGRERFKEVTILYVHAHNSEDIVAQLTPEASVEVFNEYFEGAVSAIFERKGTLDKYIGADMLAVFGSPLPLEDHAWMAAQAALEINQFVQELQIMPTLAGQLSINISIGIHSGQVFIGDIKQINADVQDVIDKDVINQAVRLSRLGQKYNSSILITESTHCLLADRFPVKEVGTVSLTLKEEVTKIYQLVDGNT